LTVISTCHEVPGHIPHSNLIVKHNSPSRKPVTGEFTKLKVRLNSSHFPSHLLLQLDASGYKKWQIPANPSGCIWTDTVNTDKKKIITVFLFMFICYMGIHAPRTQIE